MRREAAVGVVDAQVEAVLGARGEHAIGLVGALGDQVVDEDTGVAWCDHVNGGSPLSQSAALMPAMMPWHAASS